jgi:hypothetical protein
MDAGARHLYTTGQAMGPMLSEYSPQEYISSSEGSQLPKKKEKS